MNISEADEERWLDRAAAAARDVLADAASPAVSMRGNCYPKDTESAPPVIDRSILNLLKHCRPHISARATEGRGDSRDVLRWLEEEIAKLTQEIRP